MKSDSFFNAKQASKTPPEITPNQFCTDSKMLYGAIKLATRMSMPNNKYLNAHLQDKDGMKTWYKFVQDYNGEYNTATKLASLETIAGQAFDHKYKGGIIQFIDNIDSAWAQMAHLKPSEHLDDKQKIWKFTNKIARSSYALHASSMELQADGKPWEGFICNLKMLMQRTEHGLVTTPHKPHKSKSHRRQITKSDPSNKETSIVLNARTDPSWDDCNTLNTQRDDMSIPPKAWMLMCKLDPDFL